MFVLRFTFSTLRSFGDGDFYGVANALPTNANPNAYYWLDLSVTGVLGIATIRVTCDGPSDLGDHLIVARTNEVCHVPLLAGATYAVESDLPIDYSAVSTEHAEIVTNAENRLTVSLPLEFSLVRIQTRSAGTTGNYGVASSPINVRPSIIACLGGCCSREVVDGILQWSCSLTCTCGGGYHSFETTALWEGYSKLFVGYASCGCWEDAPDPTPTPSDGPYAASVSANFSKDAVIFEDAYENMPGEWVLRRSTATMLTISANGGTNGAVLSVSATNLGKLQKNSGPASRFPIAVGVGSGKAVDNVCNELRGAIGERICRRHRGCRYADGEQHWRNLDECGYNNCCESRTGGSVRGTGEYKSSSPCIWRS